MLHKILGKINITPKLLLSIPLPFSAFFVSASVAYSKMGASDLAQRYILNQMSLSAAQGAVLMLLFGVVCSSLVRHKIKEMQSEQ